MTRAAAASLRLRLIAAVFGAAALVSCADGTREDDSDRQGDDLASIPQNPSAAVCSGGAYHCYARIRVDSGNRIKTFAAATAGFGATDLATAYKLDTSVDPSATIAIVDAYNYANAASDLAVYRAKYGLPACTTASGCLRIVNQSGAASPLPAAPPANDDWTVEAALDLDMASAACPKCKLILVEATDDQGNGLNLAQNGAASLSPTVITNSWGSPEGTGGTPASQETYFNHAGIGEFVAAGDDGYNDGGSGPDYPSTSAYVTAVGGTSLVKSTTAARGWTEGAWSDGGSSCSTNIAKPSWQTSAVCGKRATADVAAVADPNTGVAVYNANAGGWTVIGGTSAASPFVAATYALTGHGAAGPSYSYAHATSFYDVTSGKNGTCGTVLCNAGAGWDGPTGIGTPNGAVLAGGSGATCVPACTGKTCGSDGCGGTCGTCASGDSCSAAGSCVAPGCTPACSGKTCGGDGCGGTCGTCASGATCGATGTCATGGAACAHPICSTGADLTASCDTCAAKVCADDDYCCNTAWDATCVGEVASICGETCSTAGTCAHAECSAGTKLKTGCDSCVTELCAADSYCCGTKWDSQCVSEVGSICGEACE